MNRLRIAIALSTLGLTIAAADVQACGESMFHSGQGMRYHAFITRTPADILIYQPGRRDSSAAQKQLYSGLEKAGHRITVVSNSDALAQALAAKHYDVVIAGERDMDAITARLDKSVRGPALLAVVARDTNIRQLRDRFPNSVREGDGLNRYLKSIDQTMQKRGT
ncbi:MAG: hypothetical protein ACREPN_07730 [Rudaea sp.]